MKLMSEQPGLVCPIPIKDYPKVVLAHGGGGSFTHDLIEKMFRPAFDNPILSPLNDGAVFPGHSGRLAFSTDSHVVSPLFFPGGDIGSLSVYGTVNDLAMCGARPLYLSAGFILEEGLPMETLWEIVQSMSRAAKETGCQIVTGDTKVVDKGKGDGVFINTSGVGVIEHDRNIDPAQVRPGDAVLISGDIGRHGMAVMAVREGIGFETTLQSDCASLAGLVQDLLAANLPIHCLRDLTRGGLATAMVEIAQSSGCSIQLDENWIPLCREVSGACELLGLDPLYVANEGRLAAFVPSTQAERALHILRASPLGENASIIGRVANEEAGLVTLRTDLGANRVITRLSGEQLPRIC